MMAMATPFKKYPTLQTEKLNDENTTRVYVGNKSESLLDAPIAATTYLNHRVQLTRNKKTVQHPPAFIVRHVIAVKSLAKPSRRNNAQKDCLAPSKWVQQGG
jgi:hypothetical protein